MKNAILNELMESGHGFIEFEAYNDGEENIEIGLATYNSTFERAAKLYLMSEYGFTEVQADAFFKWYQMEIEGDGFEFDMVQYPFSEEVLWFLESWNQEQIGDIGKGIINIQNIHAQKEPHLYRTSPDYCRSEK